MMEHAPEVFIIVGVVQRGQAEAWFEVVVFWSGTFWGPIFFLYGLKIILDIFLNKKKQIIFLTILVASLLLLGRSCARLLLVGILAFLASILA